MLDKHQVIKYCLWQTNNSLFKLWELISEYENIESKPIIQLKGMAIFYTV
jgi:hypothetical protein